MTRKLFHDSRHLQECAEEARRVAVQVLDPYSRRTMLDIAESYENLARRGHVTGATAPFSKYDAEPDLIEVMRAAFNRVCDVLRLNGDVDDRMTEIVVERIVKLAKAGELDPERLCIDALAELGTPSIAAHAVSIRGH